MTNSAEKNEKIFLKLLNNSIKGPKDEAASDSYYVHTSLISAEKPTCNNHAIYKCSDHFHLVVTFRFDGENTNEESKSELGCP